MLSRVATRFIRSRPIYNNGPRLLSTYLGAIDEGTSSTRFVISDKQGNIIASKQKELTQYNPVAGYSEHDATEIWNLTKQCIDEAMQEAKLGPKDISAIGITNQRETTVVWNKTTGKPYHKAIVWNDNRTGNICKRFMGDASNGDINKYKATTGLPLAPYFSVTKLIYLLENVPELRRDAERGEALFGTIDSWLVYNLTGGKTHVTDVSNASRTLMMDIKSCKWSKPLLDEFKVPASMLPTIVPSAGDIGTVVASSTVGGVSSIEGVKIGGILGDQQAALFGQTCFDYQDIKVTYGTGAFLLMNTGHDIIQSQHGLITTVAYQLSPDTPPVYALEGSVAYAGATMQWCRDRGQFIKNTATEAETCARNTITKDIDDFALMETEITAEQAEEEEDVYFVPAFSGLFAPHWRSDARGLIIGLTAYHTREHIVRAALESSAYSVMDVIHAMNKDVQAFKAKSSPSSPGNHSGDDSNRKSVVKVDGGMTDNKYLMQFQSNLLNATLNIPINKSNMTAMGALFAAGIGCGMYSGPVAGNSVTTSPGVASFKDELKGVWKLDKEFHSHLSKSRREHKVRNWHKAIDRSCGWHGSNNSNSK